MKPNDPLMPVREIVKQIQGYQDVQTGAAPASMDTMWVPQNVTAGSPVTYTVSANKGANKYVASSVAG